ncbi:hypothetical protein [Alkalihalobacillus sp. TS-13]|uniref:hypothetical protein n=1 Tax=Alkalihalobacillus sp. TS-13 TaxID=2842455 RepID=UPI001C88D25C|nr:hypothetical protein [Alkalihalobacillus sp. TS-13]
MTTWTTGVRYELWEYDPGSNNDDFVGFTTDTGHTFRNIGKFVDGSNNRAEFYARKYVGHGSDSVYFYD